MCFFHETTVHALAASHNQNPRGPEGPDRATATEHPWANPARTTKAALEVQFGPSSRHAAQTGTRSPTDPEAAVRARTRGHIADVRKPRHPDPVHDP